MAIDDRLMKGESSIPRRICCAGLGFIAANAAALMALLPYAANACAPNEAPGPVTTERSTPQPEGGEIYWRERRLFFHDAPLSKIVAELNRYSRRQIRIEGAAADDVRLTGIWGPDNQQSLLLFLRKSKNVSVQKEGNGWVIRARSFFGTPRK